MMKRFVPFALILLALIPFALAQEDITYAERLGYPKGSKVIFFHVDDAGMSHSSNVGTIEALTEGVATSVSTMMPCGWVPEFAHWLKENPDVDNGLHLTLTAEWDNYRWGPLAGKPAVPGLVDEEGCLWGNVAQVATKATPDEVEIEIRAQIERAETMGIPITHIDSHMGTLFATEPFLERYIKVGIEKQLPVLMMGGHCQFLREDDTRVDRFLEAGLPEMVWNGGLPVLDDLHNKTYGWKTWEEKKKNMIADLKRMKPGVTMIIVHCSRPSAIFDKITTSGQVRLDDLRLVTDPDIKKVIEEEGMILTTWRELHERRDKLDE
jgi:chitin disaccharide deacetylase